MSDPVEYLCELEGDPEQAHIPISFTGHPTPGDWVRMRNPDGSMGLTAVVVRTAWEGTPDDKDNDPVMRPVLLLREQTELKLVR